jgi:hypothetical protein
MTADDRPTETRASDDRRSGDRPSADQTGDDRPTDDRPPIPGSGPDGPPDPEPPPDRARHGADPGSYIGRLPERSAATAPGGYQRKDRR